MTRKWLEGAAGLRQETVTKSFTKSAGKRADELIINQWFHNIDSGNGNQLTIESARETSSLTAQQPAPKGKVLKLA